MKAIEERWADMLRMDALIEGMRPPLREVEFGVSDVGLCHVEVMRPDGERVRPEKLSPGHHEFVAAYDCAPRYLKERRRAKREAAALFREIRNIPGLPEPADQGLCHAMWPELGLWLSIGRDGTIRLRRGPTVDGKGRPGQEPMRVVEPSEAFEAARGLVDHG